MRFLGFAYKGAEKALLSLPKTKGLAVLSAHLNSTGSQPSISVVLREKPHQQLQAAGHSPPFHEKRELSSIFLEDKGANTVRRPIGILEINHELGARPLIASSSRKWGSILRFLDSHFHVNDDVTSEHFAISFEKGYIRLLWVQAQRLCGNPSRAQESHPLVEYHRDRHAQEQISESSFVEQGFHQ